MNLVLTPNLTSCVMLALDLANIELSINIIDNVQDMALRLIHTSMKVIGRIHERTQTAGM